MLLNMTVVCDNSQGNLVFLWVLQKPLILFSHRNISWVVDVEMFGDGFLPPDYW
jgi:hypothetical protein